MRAAVVPEAGAELEIRDREVPEPGPGEVRLRILACGVCHSDANIRDGHVPDTRFPTVPGHEVVGVVDARGPDVAVPAVGDRVGVPWLYASCGRCEQCIRGEEILCPEMEVTGATRDGGFAEYMVAAADYVAPVPGDLDSAEAAPLMCAGITVFQGLRNGGFSPGDRVAVLGLGGLGHLAVRYVVAGGGSAAVVSTSPGKEAAARELGAELFVDAGSTDVADALAGWGGGGDIILATAPSVRSMNEAFPGLAPDGTLVVMGIEDAPVQAHPMDLIQGRRRILGSPSGSRTDLRECLEFSARHGITPDVEARPLEEAGQALAEVEAGTLAGRAVLVME